MGSEARLQLQVLIQNKLPITPYNFKDVERFLE